MSYAIEQSQEFPGAWDLREISEEDAHDITAIPGSGTLVVMTDAELETLFWELVCFIAENFPSRWQARS